MLSDKQEMDQSTIFKTVLHEHSETCQLVYLWAWSESCQCCECENVLLSPLSNIGCHLDIDN